MGSGHKYACLRGPVVHVPVIVISPSDRRRLVGGGGGREGGPGNTFKLGLRRQGEKG